MIRIERVQSGRELYYWFVIYAGTIEIARFPSPEFEYTGRGQLINKANPLYGTKNGHPTFHAALTNDAKNALLDYMGKYCRALKNKKPVPATYTINLAVYDTFYTRNNG